MAVTSVTTAMAGAINYTVVTDSSADWTNPTLLPNTYFYDKADKLVHYKDSAGNIQEIFSGSGITVGTTPVTSGTNGRVFFQAGGVVQQSDRFTFDNTTATNILQLGAGANLGVSLRTIAPGATNLDIAFRVRNSADTADLISFRGDGSEWIQSVPFRHAATSTGTNNANQGILLGYNVASLSTSSLNCVVIGRGSGAILQGNGNTIIGDGFTQGTFSNSIGLGRGVFVSNSNHFFCGSDSFPVNTWWVSTGGEASSGANLRGLDFRVSGMAGGPGNISAAAHPVRFFSPNGTGNGAGSNIQFHVAPSNTGGAFFNRNIFSEMFTIRGEADGLNHYQLATPRVPSASITDGYIQYSNDITAGNAAPHFRTELGDVIKLYKNAAVTTPQGIADALTNLGVLTASTIAPSVQSVASAATVTPVNGNDLVVITAQAAALTLANPTGTWPQGKDLMIRIKDDGLGARAITWDTNYRAIGVTLPTTTVLGKTTYVGVIYNSDDAKWDVIGVTTEA